MKYRILKDGIMVKEVTAEEYNTLSENEKENCIRIFEDALPDPYAAEPEEEEE